MGAPSDTLSKAETILSPPHLRAAEPQSPWERPSRHGKPGTIAPVHPERSVTKCPVHPERSVTKCPLHPERSVAKSSVHPERSVAKSKDALSHGQSRLDPERIRCSMVHRIPCTVPQYHGAGLYPPIPSPLEGGGLGRGELCAARTHRRGANGQTAETGWDSSCKGPLPSTPPYPPPCPSPSRGEGTLTRETLPTQKGVSPSASFDFALLGTNGGNRSEFPWYNLANFRDSLVQIGPENHPGRLPTPGSLLPQIRGRATRSPLEAVSSPAPPPRLRRARRPRSPRCTRPPPGRSGAPRRPPWTP